MKRSFLFTIMAVVSIGTLVTLDVQSQIGSNSREKREIKERIAGIDELAATRINIDNQQGSPLFIQDASVREISGDDFRALTGEASAHPRQSTYPDVVLLNGSEKTIKSFAVVVQLADGKGRVMLKDDLSISPYSEYKVASSEWIKDERVSKKKGDKFVSVMRQPGLSSGNSWVPAPASDLKVIIGFVQFADGTEWTMPSN
jgi:hypothetical protein